MTEKKHAQFGWRHSPVFIVSLLSTDLAGVLSRYTHITQGSLNELLSQSQAFRGLQELSFLICTGLIVIDCGRIKHKLMVPCFTN